MRIREIEKYHYVDILQHTHTRDGENYVDIMKSVHASFVDNTFHVYINKYINNFVSFC